MSDATQEECVHCDGNGTYVTRQGSHMICTWCISDEEAVYDRVLHKMFQKTHRMDIDDNGMITVSKSGDDDLTDCFDCGKPTQRSGLFAEADVYCDECADKHQSEKREQERIRLVDGYPGEWHKDGPGWKMRLKAGPNALYVHVCKCGGSYAYAELQLQGSETKATGASFPCTWIERDNLMQAAAAIRPHAEAMVKVLEGMGDE